MAPLVSVSIAAGARAPERAVPSGRINGALSSPQFPGQEGLEGRDRDF